MSGEPGDAEIGCAMTQQAKCAKCGGGVTLFLTAWSTDKPARQRPPGTFQRLVQIALGQFAATVAAAVNGHVIP